MANVVGKIFKQLFKGDFLSFEINDTDVTIDSTKENIISNKKITYEASLTTFSGQNVPTAQWVLDNASGGTYVSNHNELAALQGGTVDERYHVPLKNYNDIIGTVQTITAPFANYILTDANNNLIIFNIETGAASGGQYYINSSVTTNGTKTMVIKNNHTSSIDVRLTQTSTKSYPLSINEKIDTGPTPITIAAGVSYIVRITKVGDYIIIQ